MKLQDVAALLHLYVAAKDFTTFNAKRAGVTDRDKIAEAADAFEKRIDAMGARKLVEYLPHLILEKRGSIGVFTEATLEEMTAVCAAAGYVLDQERAMCIRCCINPNITSYGSATVRVMDHIFYARNKNWYGADTAFGLQKAFSGVSEKAYEEFKRGLRLSELPTEIQQLPLPCVSRVEK